LRGRRIYERRGHQDAPQPSSRSFFSKRWSISSISSISLLAQLKIHSIHLIRWECGRSVSALIASFLLQDSKRRFSLETTSRACVGSLSLMRTILVPPTIHFNRAKGTPSGSCVSLKSNSVRRTFYVSFISLNYTYFAQLRECCCVWTPHVRQCPEEPQLAIPWLDNQEHRESGSA